MQEMQELQVWSLGREDPWSRKWKPTPVFLLVPYPEQQLRWLVFWILGIITSVEGYLIIVSISTAVVEHLYMCLFAICIPSLMRCLFRLFLIFYWVVFLLLSFKRSLHILGVSPLSHMWKYFIDIFFLSVAFILIFLTVHLTEQSFKILIKPNFFYEWWFLSLYLKSHNQI